MLKESEPAPRRKIINTKKPYTSASLQPDLQREAKWNHTKRPTEIAISVGRLVWFHLASLCRSGCRLAEVYGFLVLMIFLLGAGSDSFNIITIPFTPLSDLIGFH